MKLKQRVFSVYWERMKRVFFGGFIPVQTFQMTRLTSEATTAEVHLLCRVQYKIKVLPSFTSFQLVINR